ncbi:Endoplasmic reticulum mannosyl-oligosaccharide 1,2-alpha-mannosidase [Verticillium dahliae VDG2]|nr:Endoplasmic reticulum mannosyl-oligosaccharide 1,2-alpha-mannosidase [Verticillium dahliae VDG2]
MSFEDWKDLKAREAEREAQDTNPDSEKALPPPQGHDSREESDIALKVEAVSEELSSIAAPPRQSLAGAGETEQPSEPVLYDDGKAQYYRSKDAGKTCKERFSYSSFDAGATVLKTNTGAKNAKAILVENKDSYMLLECAADNKFAIVELTDDILIDTVVLANFEFFSSMIRHFKVSVSDRYPVKVDKWKDLGVFEAKNSRDIQPFLVENPLIWAKYVRIEFLTHYGNEYYCPVSLLRVHGTRMLDSWKDTEAPPDEDDAEDEPVDAVLDLIQDLDIDQAQRVPPPDNSEADEVTRQGQSIWSDVGNSVPSSPLQASLVQENPLDFTCPVNTAVLEEAASKPRSTVDRLPHETESQKADVYPAAHSDDLLLSQRLKEHWTGPLDRVDDPSDLVTGITSTDSTSIIPVTVATSRPTSVPHISSQNASRIASGSPKRPSPVAQAPTRSKNGTSASVPPASPTVQESFHKAVSKRLQLLESNVTLSLEYLEEQSRFLQQSQRASERRQLAKVDLLLDSLNHTVLSELRHVRQQYDQMWQSTVMALENQRDQSQRELVALVQAGNINIVSPELCIPLGWVDHTAAIFLLQLSNMTMRAMPSNKAKATARIPSSESISTAMEAALLMHGVHQGHG